MKDFKEHNNANEQKWDNRAETYDKITFNYFRYMQGKLVSMIKLQENTSFLDLGCGTGWAVCHVATLLKGQGQFVGVDISKVMIEKAKKNALGLENVSFYKASSDELPLENNFFDNVICTNSFHHYLNPLKALSEVYRVLKQEGKLYILDVTADDFVARWIDRKARRKEKEHVQFYSTVEYKSMFLRAGLTYIKSQSLGGFGYLMKVHIAEK